MQVLGTLIARQTGSDLMLYNPELDEVHILNSTARMIFDLYREGRTEKDIQDELMKRFCLHEDENLCQDIRQCIEDLKRKGIMAEGGAGSISSGSSPC